MPCKGKSCKNTNKDNKDNKDNKTNKAEKAEKAEKVEKTEKVDDAKNKIIHLTEELEETKQIMTKAQHDYINLKMDFDHIQNRMQKQQSDGKVDALIDVVSNFLPFVESLRKSIDNIPEDHKKNDLAKGVTMIYNNFLKALKNMNISQIEAIGLEPDTELHEPVSQIPTDNKKMKGKIIQEFEKGFVYEKGDVKKVITTSKVIIGQ